MIFLFLIAIILIAFALISWRNQRLGIALLFGLLPTYLIRFSIGPMPTTLLEGFVLITIGIGVIRSCTPDKGKEGLPSEAGNPAKEGGGLGEVSRSIGWYRIPIVLIVIGAIIGTIIVPDTLSALGILKAYIIEPLLLAVIIKTTVIDRADFDRIITALTASGAIIGAFAIAQVITHIGIPAAWVLENRATSLYDYPNAVGLFLAPIVVMAVVRFISKTPSLLPLCRGRVRDLIMIILMIGGIVAAKTEAALVAIPAALVIIGLIAPMRTSLKIGILTGTILAATFVTTLAPSITQKLTLHDSSGLVRRSQWSETLRMLADHPFLGAGLNGYPAALSPYHNATFYEIFQYPHNVFLNVWSEIGLMGLVGLIIAATMLAHTLWQKRTDPLSLAFGAALIAMMIHGLVDVPFFKNDLALLTVMCVMGVMITKRDLP